MYVWSCLILLFLTLTCQCRLYKNINYECLWLALVRGSILSQCEHLHHVGNTRSTEKYCPGLHCIICRAFSWNTLPPRPLYLSVYIPPLPQTVSSLTIYLHLPPPYFEPCTVPQAKVHPLLSSHLPFVCNVSSWTSCHTILTLLVTCGNTVSQPYV